MLQQQNFDFVLEKKTFGNQPTDQCCGLTDPALASDCRTVLGTTIKYSV